VIFFFFSNLNQAGGNESEVAGKFPNNSDTYHCSGAKILALKPVLVGKPEEKEITWDI
jgi:hypothetical protein